MGRFNIWISADTHIGWSRPGLVRIPDKTSLSNRVLATCQIVICELSKGTFQSAPGKIDFCTRTSIDSKFTNHEILTVELSQIHESQNHGSLLS